MTDVLPLIIDIQAKASWPASDLSNFAAHQFVFRGVTCASMEGLLQSLKFASASTQLAICLLKGAEAKEAGLQEDWRSAQTLWWQGQPMKRESDLYQAFLDEAYGCLFEQNENFRKALLATYEAALIHSIGVKDIKETVLTEDEFCQRLMALRAKGFASSE